MTKSGRISILMVSWMSWSCLGFYRGCQIYTRDENPDINSFKYAFNKIGSGVLGYFIYMNPISLPLSINIEYKRLTKT